MKTISLIICLALAGCATCQQHPTACAVAGTIIAASVVLSINNHDAGPQQRVNAQPVICQNGSCQ